MLGGKKLLLAVRFADDYVIERHPNVREHLHVGLFHLHFAAKLGLGFSYQQGLVISGVENQGQ